MSEKDEDEFKSLIFASFLDGHLEGVCTWKRETESFFAECHHSKVNGRMTFYNTMNEEIKIVNRAKNIDQKPSKAFYSQYGQPNTAKLLNWADYIFKRKKVISLTSQIMAPTSVCLPR